MDLRDAAWLHFGHGNWCSREVYVKYIPVQRTYIPMFCSTTGLTWLAWSVAAPALIIDVIRPRTRMGLITHSGNRRLLFSACACELRRLTSQVPKVSRERVSPYLHTVVSRYVLHTWMSSDLRRCHTGMLASTPPSLSSLLRLSRLLCLCVLVAHNSVAREGSHRKR